MTGGAWDEDDIIDITGDVDEADEAGGFNGANLVSKGGGVVSVDGDGDGEGNHESSNSREGSGSKSNEGSDEEGEGKGEDPWEALAQV